MTAEKDIARMREVIAANRDRHREPPTRTLDDLAEANPELHERVDRVRQQIPNARMKEDKPEEAARGANNPR